MSEVTEQYICNIKSEITSIIGYRGPHTAWFIYPVCPENTRAQVHFCYISDVMPMSLQAVRDLHTFFAQLEEEMVRRMPAPAPVVEAVPEREPFPEPSPSDPQRGRPA